MPQDKTLIDGNSVGYHHHQIGRVLKAGDQQTQAVFGSLQAIRNIATRRRGTSLIVLWDGRSWRKDVYTSYKAQREATPQQRQAREDYTSQTPYLKRALKALGIGQASAANLEADDLASLMVDRATRSGERVALYTRDRDWLQLVRKGVVWYDHADENRIAQSNFEEETGFATPFQFAQSKALIGEPGDLGSGSGVGGIGKKKAEEILSIWPTVEAFLADPNPHSKWTASKTFPRALEEFRLDSAKQERFARNMRLIDISTPANIPAPLGLSVVKGLYDRNAFIEVCRELGFHSFLNSLDEFLFPFQPITETV